MGLQVTRKVAFDELQKCAGTQFDAEVVSAFIDRLTHVETIGTTPSAVASPVIETITPSQQTD